VFYFKSSIPIIIWAFTILVLSGYPGDKIIALPLIGFDKLVHIIMYTGFSFLLCLAIKKEHLSLLKDKSLVILISVLYGGFMEICQHYIFINRNGNWPDVIANSIGAILGILIYPFVIKWLPLKRWLK